MAAQPAINVVEVAQALEASVLNDVSIRKQAESYLLALENGHAGLIPALFQIYTDASASDNLRRLAIIFAKNVIQRRGPGEHMEAVKGILVSLISTNQIQTLPHKTHLGVLIAKSCYTQFPDKFPGLPQALGEMLAQTNLIPYDQLSGAPATAAGFDAVPCAAFVIKKILQQRVRRNLTGKETTLNTCRLVLPRLIDLWTQSAMQMGQLNAEVKDLPSLPAQLQGKAQHVVTTHRFLTGAVLVALKLVGGTKPHEDAAVCAAAQQALEGAILSIRVFMSPAIRSCQVGQVRRYAVGCVRTYLKWLADLAKPSPLLFVTAADGVTPAGADGGLAKAMGVCVSLLDACRQLWRQVDQGALDEEDSLPDSTAKHALTLIEHILSRKYVFNLPSASSPAANELGQRGMQLAEAAAKQLETFFSQQGDLSSLSSKLADVCLFSSEEDLNILMHDPDQALARPECRDEGRMVIDTASSGIFAAPVAKALETRLAQVFAAKASNTEQLQVQEQALTWAAAAKRSFAEAGVAFQARVGLLVQVLTTHENPLLHARAGDLAKAWYDAEKTPEAFAAAMEVLVRVLGSPHALCKQTAVEHLKSLYLLDAEHEAWARVGAQVADQALMFAATLKTGHYVPLELASFMILNETSAAPSAQSVQSLFAIWRHVQAALIEALDAAKKGQDQAKMDSLAQGPDSTIIVAAQCALVDTVAGIMGKTQDVELVTKARMGALVKRGKLSPQDVPTGSVGVGLPISVLQTVGLIAADVLTMHILTPLQAFLSAPGRSEDDEIEIELDTEVKDLVAAAVALLTSAFRSAAFTPAQLLDPSTAAIPGDQRGNLLVWSASQLIKHGAKHEELIWTFENQVLDLAAEITACAVAAANTHTLNAAAPVLASVSGELPDGNSDADAHVTRALASGASPLQNAAPFLSAVGGADVLAGVLEIVRRGLEDSKSQVIDRSRQTLTVLVPLLTAENANQVPEAFLNEITSLVSSVSLPFFQRPLDKAMGGSPAVIAELAAAWTVHNPQGVAQFAHQHNWTVGHVAQALVAATQIPTLACTAPLTAAACALIELQAQQLANDEAGQRLIAEVVSSVGRASPLADAACSDMIVLLTKNTPLKKRSAFTERDELSKRPISLRLRALVQASASLSKRAAVEILTGASAQAALGNCWVFSRAAAVASACSSSQRLVVTALPPAAGEQLVNGGVLPQDVAQVLKAAADVDGLLMAVAAEVNQKSERILNMM